MADGTKNRPVIAFTNGTNEAKKLDVQRLIDEYPASDGGALELNFDEDRDVNDFLYACPRTPLAPINFSFVYDLSSTSSNFTNRQGVQFSYQNVYKDGSVSSLAPYSDIAIPPAILGLGASSITEKAIENVCNLSIPYQGSEVEFINLIFREGNDGVPFLFDKVPNSSGSKNPDYDFIGASITGIYRFRNDKTGVILNETDRFKTFDNLPKAPKAQTVADDRLIYGNYKEGYDNVDVDVTLSVELADAPAPGYSFEIKAHPYVFRERVAPNTDYGTAEAARSNVGFVVDWTKCPEEILPGTYTLNVLFAPSQNYHIFTGAGDFLSLIAIPEKRPFSTTNDNMAGAGGAGTSFGDVKGWPYGSGDATSANYHAARGYNNSTYTNDGQLVSWDSESGDTPLVGVGAGTSISAPIIVNSTPIEFKVVIEVTSETTRSELEDSFAHAMYGLPFDQAPIYTSGNGSITFPTSNLQTANIEVEFDLGFDDGDFFIHENTTVSDLVCGFQDGGLFIINKAKLRFFLETGVDCVGVGAGGNAGKIEFSDQSDIGGGWGMKLCLAHMYDVDVKTCIPIPEPQFGSYVNPVLNPADGSNYLSGLDSSLNPAVQQHTSNIRRTTAAGTSLYDYYVTDTNTRALCWPDQRVQFDPDLTQSTPLLFGPAGRDQLISGVYDGYARSTPEAWAKRSETPDFNTAQSALSGSNNTYIPAPIKRWYVFDTLKNRFSDDQWYSDYGLGLAYDVVGADNGGKTAAELLVKGNPSTFFGERSKFWVGEMKNHSFVDSSSGINYCRLGLNRGYTTPGPLNISELLAGEINKLSLVDGTCGPGGLNGYAYTKFGDMDSKWEYTGTSTDGYQGLVNRDVKSGNRRGSVTNFHLHGWKLGLPFIKRPGVTFRQLKNSESFFGPNISDAEFANAISGAALFDQGLLAYYNQEYFDDAEDVPFKDSAYTYGENFDITSEFAPDISSTAAPQLDTDGVIDLLAAVSPADLLTVTNFHYRKTTQTAPQSAGSGGDIPSSSIGSNIGVSGSFSFKSSATHEFGIVYFDERGRHGSVQPVGSVYVPGYSGQERPSGNLGAARVRLKINSTPPPWAKSYKIVYGGNNTTSEFIQYSTNQAFLEKNADTDLEQSRIYVSLNYLQSSDVSYAEAYGAISQDDGTKFLYRFAPGDELKITQYSSESGNVLTPPRPYVFRVLDVVTLDPDMTNHPLFNDGEGGSEEGDPGTNIAANGEFVVIENNATAEGFTVADIQAQTSKWKDRVIFEISRPRAELSDVARPYYETNYGGQVTTSGKHQYTEFLMTKGDVFFRQVPVNSNNPIAGGGFQSNIAGSVQNPTRFKSNFIGYFLETEGVTDLYRSDAKNYGRVHFVDSSAAEYERISSLSFSEKTFTGSSDVNYFSFPQIGNFKDLPISNGEIQRLYSDNVILNCYQTSKTSLIPVSRDVLQTGEEDVIVKSSKVLGTPTELKTGYSIHDNPESLVVVNGDHYFFDKRSKKIIMLKQGREAVAISDLRVDSYVRNITNQWGNDEWKAFMGHDPSSNELLFALVTQSDLTGSATSSPFGSLAFDLKTKKYWKTRYSYVSQFFSKIGGNLLGFWHAPQTTQVYPYMFTPSATKNKFFDNDGAAQTSFSCISNQAPESAKEFVMLNSVADKYISATVSTDQSSTTDIFKVWKDYDGVKYAEIPKKPATPEQLGRSQKSNWLPTYPALESSAPSNTLEFKNESDGAYVYMKMFVSLSSSVWRAPIPTGKKTFLVESTQGSLRNFYACGSHPDSDVILNRSISIHSTYKDQGTGMGVIEFRMPWSVIHSGLSDDETSWESDVNIPADGFYGDEATFKSALAALVNRISSDYSYDSLTFLFSSNFEIDASDTALWTDEEIANLARLFFVPIMSCTGINAAAAKAAYDGELPLWNPADLNNDGAVSTNDILLLLENFGESGTDLLGDIVSDDDIVGGVIGLGDGAVTAADFLALLSQFGQELVQGCTNPLATNYDPAANFDDGSCILPDEGDGDGSEPADINLWWLATQSQNKQIYVGYSNSIDGVHMKGRYARINASSAPGDGELNLESLMVDFNVLNKNPGQGVLNKQSKRKK